MSFVIIDRRDVVESIGNLVTMLLGQVLSLSDGTFIATDNRNLVIGKFASREEATQAVLSHQVRQTMKGKV